MVRRTIAIGGGLLVFILLVLLFRGCLDARKERAMEDYVRDANELVGLSKAESRQLFEILRRRAATGPGGEPAEPGERAAGRTRPRSSDRARDLDVPGRALEAQDYFLEASSCAATRSRSWRAALPGALAEEERRESTGRHRAR